MNQTNHASTARKSALFLTAIMIWSIFFSLFSVVTAQAATNPKALSQANSISGGIRGIDVSSYQGAINWTSVAGTSVKFAMIRASNGMTGDKNFLYNARGADEAGLYVGAYHYARFTNRATMQAEAEFFLSQISQVNITYPVVLDLEAARGMSRSTLTTLAVEFMDILRSKGYTVMFYTYNNFVAQYLNASQLRGYNWWIANYLEEPSMDQKIWQYSCSGSVSGIKGNVDLNIAYIDLSVRKGYDPDISAAIRQSLYDIYKLGLNVTDKELQKYLIGCMQSHLNYRLGTTLEFDGKYNEDTKQALYAVDFLSADTDKQFLVLLQTMMFYKGFYTEKPTGALDEETVKALKLLQGRNNLEATGLLDARTLDVIMNDPSAS